MGFLICGSCARHVKAHDAACPFCGASTRDANRAGNPGQSRARSRLAILFGATTALITGATVASCGGKDNDASASDDSHDAAFTAVDAYGAAAPAAFYGCSIPDACGGGEPPAEDSGAHDSSSDANASDARDVADLDAAGDASSD